MDILKIIVPLLIGLFLAPYIEDRKSRVKSKKTLKNFKEELNDELSDLSKKLIKMSKSLAGFQAIKTGDPKEGQIGKYLPRKEIFYFTESVIENSFSLLSKEERYAIKSLLMQIDALNGYISKIRHVPVHDDTLDMFIDNCKRYLFTGASMLNTMRIIAQKPLANKSGNDDDIINNIFRELDINLTADELKIKKTITFNQAS